MGLSVSKPQCPVCLSASKPQCPVCGDCEPTKYLMKDSPYICIQCDTEWDQKTHAVLKRGIIGIKRPSRKEQLEIDKLYIEKVIMSVHKTLIHE